MFIFCPRRQKTNQKNAGEFTVHSLPTGIGLYVLFFLCWKKSVKRNAYWFIVHFCFRVLMFIFCPRRQKTNQKNAAQGGEVWRRKHAAEPLFSSLRHSPPYVSPSYGFKMQLTILPKISSHFFIWYLLNQTPLIARTRLCSQGEITNSARRTTPLIQIK